MILKGNVDLVLASHDLWAVVRQAVLAGFHSRKVLLSAPAGGEVGNSQIQRGMGLWGVLNMAQKVQT